MGLRGAMLAKLLTLFVVVSVLESHNSLAADATRVDVQTRLELGKAQRGFDYFVFAQQWPGTFCKQSGTCCEDVQVPVNFTVHGLWPEYENGSWPSCCSGPSFDQAKIDELTDLLEEDWPTMSCKSPEQCSGRRTGSFWQHEWEKHGTCGYPIIPDEATYFSIGLNLHLRYDILKILSDAGFVPSSSRRYETSQAVAAVRTALGAKPVFSCKSGQINEVWVCLTQDLKIRDCGPTGSNNCPKALQIPPFNLRSNMEEFL